MFTESNLELRRAPEHRVTHFSVCRGTVSSMVIRHEEAPAGSPAGRPPVIFNPDFFVEKLRHENPEVFLELVISNVTRLIDLPGTEFSQLLGEEGPKTPTGGNGGFFRSLNFLKRKGETWTSCSSEETSSEDRWTAKLYGSAAAPSEPTGGKTTVFRPKITIFLSLSNQKFFETCRRLFLVFRKKDAEDCCVLVKTEPMNPVNSRHVFPHLHLSEGAWLSHTPLVVASSVQIKASSLGVRWRTAASLRSTSSSSTSAEVSRPGFSTGTPESGESNVLLPGPVFGRLCSSQCCCCSCLFYCCSFGLWTVNRTTADEALVGSPEPF